MLRKPESVIAALRKSKVYVPSVNILHEAVFPFVHALVLESVDAWPVGAPSVTQCSDTAPAAAKTLRGFCWSKRPAKFAWSSGGCSVGALERLLLSTLDG